MRPPFPSAWAFRATPEEGGGRWPRSLVDRFLDMIRSREPRVEGTSRAGVLTCECRPSTCSEPAGGVCRAWTSPLPSTCSKRRLSRAESVTGRLPGLTSPFARMQSALLLSRRRVEILHEQANRVDDVLVSARERLGSERVRVKLRCNRLCADDGAQTLCVGQYGIRD